MTRILVTGARTWTDQQAVFDALDEATHHIPAGHIVIVHGDCPTGADFFAHQWAFAYGVLEEPHPADWAKHGRAAGMIRNQEMADRGADLCLAFPGPESVGTWDMIRKARAAGIPVHIHEPGGSDDHR